MCTGLDPDFNVWQRLAPHARKMIEEEGGSPVDMLLEQVGEFVKALVAVPDQMSRVLTSFERGEITMNMPLVNRQIYHLEGAVNKLVGSMLFSAFFFGGVLLITAGHTTLGYISWGFSAPPLLWTIFLSRGHSPWAPP
jgi:predicted unusual protein kinase regulating ubiquinone biosynthesis (AarF/ABC1/UbiB family)